MREMSFTELDRRSIRTGCETKDNRAAELELKRRGYVFNASLAKWIKKSTTGADQPVTKEPRD